MRDHEDRQKFLDILEDMPLVSVAAKRAGIAKSTIYRWRQKSRAFARQMEATLKRGRDTVNDLAESQLINLVRKGDFKSVRYWLDNNKKEYARPRPKNFWESFKMENPVTAVNINVTGNPENVAKIKKALAKKRSVPHPESQIE